MGRDLDSDRQGLAQDTSTETTNCRPPRPHRRVSICVCEDHCERRIHLADERRQGIVDEVILPRVEVEADVSLGFQVGLPHAEKRRLPASPRRLHTHDERLGRGLRQYRQCFDLWEAGEAILRERLRGIDLQVDVLAKHGMILGRISVGSS